MNTFAIMPIFPPVVGEVDPLVGEGVECAHCFPCVSYETTKRGLVPMAAHVRRGTTPASCVTSSLVHNTDSTLF